MNYADTVLTLQNLLQYPDAAEANFVQILPLCLQTATLKMVRDPDLDFLGLHNADSTVSCTPNSRDVTMPADLAVVEELNLITPATTNPDAGTRVPLQRVSLAMLNQVAPTAATVGVPTLYALLTDTAVRLAVTPDDDYKLEFIGLFTPEVISASETTTFINDNLPDLFIAACMEFMAGYQRDFGAQSEDPKLAQSWANYYNDLKRGAAVQSARQKAQSSQWTAYPPTVAATPPRG